MAGKIVVSEILSDATSSNTIKIGTGMTLDLNAQGTVVLPAGSTGVDGITTASSSGTAINIASDNDVGVRGAPDAGTTLQVNSGSGENGLHLKQIGNSGGAFAKFIRVSSGDTSNGHWELHHESKNLTIKTNAAAGSISSPTLTDVFKVCQDGRGLSQFTAHSWISFNGQGTASIRDSHNISSLADSGTGWMKAYFANNLNNADYCCAASASNAANTYNTNIGTACQYVNYLGIMSWGDQTGTSHAANDFSHCSAIVFGD
jgi:hypothetical protein